MAPLLSRKEVDGLLNLQTAMAVLEQVYREQAAGGIDAVPPLRLMNWGIRLVAGDWIGGIGSVSGWVWPGRGPYIELQITRKSWMSLLGRQTDDIQINTFGLDATEGFPEGISGIPIEFSGVTWYSLPRALQENRGKKKVAR